MSERGVGKSGPLNLSGDLPLGSGRKALRSLGGAGQTECSQSEKHEELEYQT
jgi:hypothetical protein